MHTFLAQCSAAFNAHGSLFSVFFLGGLSGSLTHCLTMCGPVVACQAACGRACQTKLSTMSQWQYHAGRLVMYSLLGFLAALFSTQLMATPYWPTISASLLVCASALFLITALRPAAHGLFKLSPKHFFLRGILMSFMPCGLLYAALMAAAALADPISGMFAMMFFVLGTMPALLAASSSISLLAQKWNHAIGRIGRIGIACNGLTLLVLATNLVR